MSDIVNKAEQYISVLLTENLDEKYLFHNLGHTKSIVSKSIELLEANKNKEVNDQQVLLAAWFLYSGFSLDYKEPMENSCELARKFLTENEYENEVIDKVCQLIRSAWTKDEPLNEEEKVIKDARLSFYASKDFEELLVLLHMELQNFEKSIPTIEEWRKRYIEILRTEHHFYTDYAKEKWQKKKVSNELDLIGSAAKALKTKKKEKLKAKLKDKSPGRAIQSLYRIQLRNHLKLSDIADTKANILLSVNAIIISLLMANLIPKLGVPNNSYLIYPTVIFVMFSIASMIMSVLATRPKIENKDVVEGEIKKKNTNFLFFGNFHTMEPQDFKNKIRDIIKDTETIYDSLTMDLYYLGKVLQKKYRLLSWTYTVFIVGVVLSVLAFAIALKYYGMDDEILDAVTPLPK
ncbi:phosphohydrolase [Arenibacter sp. BSSL-BM3]|uniref:Phosphohydrolase n=1 Tax=Arenibacter arenosicollis TaxID=2762274 RepID=A0ABR7QPA6_9FLAO|nr:Pycsar system effector family protein [Arenibacter arenosicollis]MBC8768874.1 phosphohydrolase [Arenibacter arenosicollis]